MADVTGNMSVPTPESRFDFSSFTQFRKLPSPTELIQITRKYVRPWTEFLNTSNFKTVPSMPRLSSRIMRNLSYFQSNYICVFIVLMIYCLITSPLILIVLVAAAYGSHKVKQSRAQVTFCGYPLTTKQQVMAVNMLSAPILFLVGAGSALFWTLGASCFVIALHSIFYNIDAIVTEDAEDFLSEVV